MKHGISFRKFSRTSSHRMLMLRNLVTSLLEHEQIKTTLPKARDTARLAEKIITLGKKGDLPAFKRASSFILKPEVTRKLFQTFAARYSDRPGGYTRIHKYGNRPGDNAPHAILELVDNPRDLKFEMTARAVGWDLLSSTLRASSREAVAKVGVPGVAQVVERLRHGGTNNKSLRPLTQWNLQKVMKYRSTSATNELVNKASEYIDTLLAKSLHTRPVDPSGQENVASSNESQKYFRNINDLQSMAGEVKPGGDRVSALRTAQGALAIGPGRQFRWLRKGKLGVSRSAFTAQSG